MQVIFSPETFIMPRSPYKENTMRGMVAVAGACSHVKTVGVHCISSTFSLEIKPIHSNQNGTQNTATLMIDMHMCLLVEYARRRPFHLKRYKRNSVTRFLHNDHWLMSPYFFLAKTPRRAQRSTQLDGKKAGILRRRSWMFQLKKNGFNSS